MSLLRQSPSGPVIGDSDIGNSGMIIKSNTECRVVVNGEITDVPHEIKENMNVVDNVDTMRPVIEDVSITNHIQFETSFDIGINTTGTDLTCAIQASRDEGATWVEVASFTRVVPSTPLVTHIHMLTEQLVPTVITGFTDGDDVTARVIVSTENAAAGYLVRSEAPTGTASCTVREMLP